MSPRSASPKAERRHNHVLREILEELVGHARDIARRARSMSPEELQRAQARLEWLADEVGREATGLDSPLDQSKPTLAGGVILPSHERPGHGPASGR